MIDAAQIYGFAMTSLLVELTPGPNMAYLAMVAATGGRRRGYAAVAGVALGLAVVGLAAALGLAAVISRSVFAYQALRLAGTGYLLWLAWEAWRGGESGSELAGLDASLWVYFKRGLLTNLLNPKAAVFYLAVLPGFLPAQAGIGDAVLLSAVYVAVATGVHAGLVTLAGTAQNWLADEKRAGRVRRGMALVLIGVAVWLLLKT